MICWSSTVEGMGFARRQRFEGVGSGLKADPLRFGVGAHVALVRWAVDGRGAAGAGATAPLSQVQQELKCVMSQGSC